MKASTIGIVVAAILVVAAGVGVGIAQAAGNHSDRPVSSLDEQVGAGNLAEPMMEPHSQQKSGPGADYSSYDWHVGEPVETGSMTERSDANDLDHTDIPREGNVYQYWGAEDPSK